MVVLAIVAILAALVVGQIRRYRATVQMRTDIENISSTLQTTVKQLARISSLPHPSPVARSAASLSSGRWHCRVIKKEAGQTAPTVNKEFDLEGLQIVTVTRLDRIDYSAASAQGVALEFGLSETTPFQQSFCIPIEPDGTFLAAPGANPKTGVLQVSNGYNKAQIEVSPTGNTKVIDNVP